MMIADHDRWLDGTAAERETDVQDWQIAEQLRDMPHRRACPYGRKGPKFICTCPEPEPFGRRRTTKGERP